MGSILTHTFGTYTVFRTIHSIYENTNEVAPCIVAFTPCNDMMLSPSTMEYELQDVFDTFDYLLKNQFDLFAKCEQRLRVDLELDSYDLKTLLRGKLRFPINSHYADGTELQYITHWFVDKCPKCGCYLYYPKYNSNSGYTGVCANCFEERTLERLKAINFPTEKSGQLVNYKYYTVAGIMNRNELEQFMKELGNEKYCNGTLMSIDKDLNMLELGAMLPH